MAIDLEPLESLTGLGFPEALRWRDGALWFSDMFRSRVLRWLPGSAPEVVVDSVRGGPRMPGGLGWLPDGRLLVVDCLERRVLAHESDGRFSVHADLASSTSHPLNDMHVDSDGTAWVGGYGFDPEHDPPSGSPVHRIGPDGSISATAARLVFPNGCERTTDGLVIAETFADRLAVLDDAGAVRSTVALPEGSGPDGLSIAPDGTVWVALAFAGQLLRQRVDGVIETRAVTGDRAARDRERGVFDCAVSNSGTVIAVATADGDEAYARENDTGAIRLLAIR